MIEIDAPIQTEWVNDHVACITYDRPKAMNAYNEALLRGVVEALEQLDNHDQVRSIILTGAGEAFCAGVDLEDMPLTPEMDFAEYEAGLGLFQEVVRTIRGIKTPVIAAINGYALGAGCDTALACDFRVVSEEGVIGETFIDVGFVPGDGGAFLLPRLIGEARAKELIFTGKKISGKEIVEWDLAVDQVSQEELLDRTIRFANKLVDQPPIALGESKQLVNESFSVNLDQALSDATRAQRICAQTDDHEEAISAFQENREPEFEGQ